MEYTVQVIIERAALLRRQLAELERSVETGKEVPEELWQEIQKLSSALDQEVRKAQAASRVMANQVNDIRQAILDTLENYNHWREQMRQVEDLFLIHVVRPGIRLKQAVHQREYLENEYQHLRKKIDIGHYDSFDDLKSEILSVLKRDDVSYYAQDSELEHDDDRDTTMFDLMEQFDVDRLVDEIERESVLRDFKRVVMPKIHPDTSTTSVETFRTVYEVFEKRDYLLMEAYIVQYQGEFVPDPIEDPFLVLHQIDQHQQHYTEVKSRLQKRMDQLRKELTPQELEDPEKLKQTLRDQQTEINARIQEEAEQILQLRQKIEGLVDYYHVRNA